MTKNEKKELFLLIIELWFDDKTGQINEENCIGFYNYFIDCLEFEALFSIEEEPGFHNFIISIIDFLCDFPSYKDYVVIGRDNIKSFMLEFGQNVDINKINIFIPMFDNLFNMFKQEYII